LGEWIQLNFDAESGDYSQSQIVYNFNSNNTLEIFYNNVLKATYTYEIILTTNYPNIFVSTKDNKQLAVLKAIDKEDNDYVDVYSIKMIYNDSNKLIMGMEFPRGTYNNMTLEKK
jgi:predicted aldo/keto reductase-like oxidoreductase